MDARRLITELKSRGVYRVAALYSAGAWALLQVADLIFPVIGLPEGSVTLVLVVAAVGFPFAIALAWWFDLTPDGLVEAPVSTVSGSRPAVSTTHIIELALILLLMFSVGYLYLDRIGEQSADWPTRKLEGLVDQRPSIAVMPFVNMSDEPNTGYFGDGLAEEILNLLAKLNELNVAARTSSFYFKDKDVDIRQVGQRLGVAHVLEGSVRRNGDQVRITAQLIDANNGFHLWSETYDRSMNNLLALQDDIAAEVVAQLEVILSSESKAVLAKSEAVDPLAYDYYLRGREYLRSPRDSANQANAVAFFRRAIEVNASFADAHAGLCDALLSQYESSLTSANYREAENSCQQALKLDDGAFPVHIALGNLYRNAGRYARARQQFKRALAVNPMAVDAYLGLAEIYAARNDRKQAELGFAVAIDLQPNYWRAHTGMGNFLFNEGRVEESIPYFKKITELMPGSESALSNLGASYYLSGKMEEAVAAWEQSVVLAPSGVAFSNLGSSLYFSGRFGEAAQKYQAATTLEGENYEYWGNLADAVSYSAPGAQQQARQYYQRASELAMDRLRVNPSDFAALALLGYYQASLGNTEQALEFMRQVAREDVTSMHVHYVRATTYCTLGLPDQALAELKLALAQGYPWALVGMDVGLQSLRAIPGYQQLAAEHEATH